MEESVESGSMLPARYYGYGSALETTDESEFGKLLKEHYEELEAAERAVRDAREADDEAQRMEVVREWETKLRPGLEEALGDEADNFEATRFDRGLSSSVPYPGVTFRREDVEVTVYDHPQGLVVRYSQGLEYAVTIRNLSDLATAYYHSKALERQRKAMPTSRFEQFTKDGGSVAELGQ